MQESFTPANTALTFDPGQADELLQLHKQNHLKVFQMENLKILLALAEKCVIL